MPAIVTPAISVATVPKRAISSDPTSDTTPNVSVGSPERMPISVPERCRSA
jgi:hypothetical protein